MLHWVDDYLIDRAAQPVADWLARWTTVAGVVNFLLTGAVVVLAAEGGLFLVAGRTGHVALIGLQVLGQLGAMFILDREGRAVRDGCAPSVRLSFFVTRMIWMFLVVYELTFYSMVVPVPPMTVLWKYIDCGSDWLILASLYLAACRRNPPLRRRAQARAPAALDAVS